MPGPKTPGFGAWLREDGSAEWVSGVKPATYHPLDSTIECRPGVVPKASGNPFGTPSVGEWAAAAGHPEVEEQMWNVVRKCGECGKPNAYTLEECNSCAAKLPEETTRTANLFSCIVYGFDAVGLSLRHQTDRLLVIDDLLCLSGCHINSIWAKHWIRDVRTLFLNPAVSVRILDEMFAAVRKVYLEAFVANKAFVGANVRNPPTTDEGWLDMVACGFNTPPSQYQLHMQFVMAPVLPFHAAQLLKGLHFTLGRFCPFGYVRKALELAAGTPSGKLALEIKDTTKMEEIFAEVGKLGLDYEQAWSEMMNRVNAKQAEHGNYPPENFSGTHCDADGADPNTTADRLALTSYGRPYTEDGKPAATNHYHYAKSPGEVKPYGPDSEA
eukprot:TRINITY_DN12129_c0_g1_i1.p1 TRINITY_DN12129_c0_g1~~TRINITY_DN12129_c0_g1_i1.p1  ORF type:complete len:384 (+),score=137.52 TRINITY_DN12129_c0_g1_i1:72-1223(+)